MPFPHRVHAVILDMDGTLHDTETVYHRALKHAAAGVGFSVSDAFCHSLIGIPGRESDQMLRDHMGPDFPFDAYDRLYLQFRDAALADGVPVKPGVTALLDYLAASGLPMPVATSASRRAAELQLTRSGLRSRFATVVTRDDVARGKPHPDLFLLAARHIGVDPRHCLVIEDSANGVRAAHAAGMMPVMVPDLVPPSAEIRAMTTRVEPDLHAVLALLRAHRSQAGLG